MQKNYNLSVGGYLVMFLQWWVILYKSNSMESEVRRDSADARKQKKKKHHHSRSESRKHKKEKDKERPSSRDRKKDKEKKKHKSRSRSKEREEKKERGIEEKKIEKEREEKRDKDRDREREEVKERDREERRDKDREVEKPKEKQREKEKERERDRDKQKQKEKERDRKDKARSKSKDKDRKRDHDHSKSRKHDQRERERSRDKKRHRDDRSRGKDRAREDKYQRWRKEANFRFDSPPKSDDSDGSDDPQKVDRLNKMKAQKELVSSKADRKLYLGNLPPNITSNQLMQMLNAALKKMQINCEEDGDSIVSAWISPDGVGHYAFVEFRTAQQATAGLALNGASLYGYQLKLGRPKQYIEYHKQLLSEFGSDGNIDTILRKVQAMGGFTAPPKIQERLVHPPSRVVVLKHVVTVEELAIDEEYTEIVEDVTDMAKRHGDVLKVVIPRPMEIDLEEVKKRVKGLGYIFIKYRTVEQAKYARKQFIKQNFSERSVACGFFLEKNLEEGELDVSDKVIIDF